MTKLISFAGVSRVNGELKFRGAQNVNRITQLRKLGDTDVEMLFLGSDMTKSQAAKELLARDFAAGRADIEALLVSVAKDDNPFVKPKKARTVKVKRSELIDDDQPLTARQRARLRAEFNERVRIAYEAN